MKAAAEFIAVSAGVLTKAPGKAAEPSKEAQQGRLERLARVHAKLRFEHPAVQALGLSAEVVERLSIGMKVGGVFSGRILFPLYQDGVLFNYCGFKPEADPPIVFPPSIAERL